MNEKKETTEDILDGLLSKDSVDALAAIDSAETIRILLGHVASQIKAAAKREKAATEADALKVGGLVEATRHKSDNAALRDALKRILAIEGYGAPWTEAKCIAQKALEGAQCTPPIAQETEKIEHSDNAAATREDDANLSSWDGVDAQIDALKRLARTRVGGHKCAMPCAEFADIVERLDAARKRELASPGNSAAMRKALIAAKGNFDSMGANALEGELNLDAVAMICASMSARMDAALSAPPRNCDVGTPDEQAERFEAECKRHDRCTPCPVHAAWGEFKEGKPKSCQIIWAQMPYAPAEGGAE